MTKQGDKIGSSNRNELTTTTVHKSTVLRFYRYFRKLFFFKPFLNHGPKHARRLVSDSC